MRRDKSVQHIHSFPCNLSELQHCTVNSFHPLLSSSLFLALCTPSTYHYCKHLHYITLYYYITDGSNAVERLCWDHHISRCRSHRGNLNALPFLELAFICSNRMAVVENTLKYVQILFKELTRCLCSCLSQMFHTFTFCIAV